VIYLRRTFREERDAMNGLRSTGRPGRRWRFVLAVSAAAALATGVLAACGASETTEDEFPSALDTTGGNEETHAAPQTVPSPSSELDVSTACDRFLAMLKEQEFDREEVGSELVDVLGAVGTGECASLDDMAAGLRKHFDFPEQRKAEILQRVLQKCQAAREGSSTEDIAETPVCLDEGALIEAP
jgi:hypothetical protein